MEEGNADAIDRFAGQVIRGKVLIPAEAPAFQGATAHVRLEELSGEDDKGAAVRAETTIPRISQRRWCCHEDLSDFISVLILYSEAYLPSGRIHSTSWQK